MRTPLPAVAAAFGLLAGAALAPPVRAQDPSGAIRGVVRDSSGGQIVSAQIAVEARGSSLRREAASDSRGEFRIDQIAPEAYVVLVDARGFVQARTDAIVNASSVREIQVVLLPALSPQTVTVPGRNSSITAELLEHRDSRGLRPLLQRPRPKRLGGSVPGRKRGSRPLSGAFRPRMHPRRRRRSSDRPALSHSLRHSRHRRRPARL